MNTVVFISVFLATFFYILGFIILLLYKRDKIKKIEEELEAINNILDSSDKMINELNNLSGYIISNMEDKSKELKKILTKADSKIKELDSHIEAYRAPVLVEPIEEKPVKKAKEETDEKPKKQTKRSSKTKESTVDQVEIIKENIITKPASSIISEYEANKKQARKVEQENKSEASFIDTVILEDDTNRKVAFVVNSKAQSVIEMAKQGMDTTEIAKRLGIGKGEIELILGLKK